ncbi:MAG: 4'-phosphopantetheinyl transferase superfamily protein [bacterium]
MLTKEPIVEPFPIPLGFGPLPGYRVQGIVRSPWQHPVQAAGLKHGWCCQCVDEYRANAWEETAAPFILLESEWKHWRSLPHTAAKRRWLRGRVAAKDAVRLLLMDRYNMAAALETISVLPNEHGQPQVHCTALPKTGAWVSVSISHCGNSSVALAAERSEASHGVGIDVAAQFESHEGLAEGGFVSTEMALLEDCPGEERSDWLLRLWCAKESVGKVLGFGLMGNPLNYLVRRVDRGASVVEVEIKLESSVTPQSKTRMAVNVGSDRGMTFAVAHREGN